MTEPNPRSTVQERAMAEQPNAEYVAPADSPERTAERLGCSIEWAHEHTGWHTCIDGRTYDTSCLVRDPTCDSIARGFLRRAQIDGSEVSDGA
jgi:hypothetical protein